MQPGTDATDHEPLRVAYTLEQCWHPSPGGTAVAALRIAEHLRKRSEVELHYVAGKHARPPAVAYRPDGPVAMLPIARPLLYETWTRLDWPKVEAVTGPIDVAHATGLVPCATAAPLVVSLHDLAFRRDPTKFTGHGVRVMERSLRAIVRRADRVICPSEATMADCREAGIPADRLRLVPLGVEVRPAVAADIERVRRRHELPERFVLFVGTIEPRKNLVRLVDAIGRTSCGLPLVVAGAHGWGDAAGQTVQRIDVRFLGFVPDDELSSLYAAAAVVAYPSEWEGFGLPVIEAMAQGTPVVTSRDTATEEVAGGAAVLVDPFDVASIAVGIDEAVDRREELAEAGRRRAGELSWESAARRTLDVYRELVHGAGPADLAER